MTEPAPFLKFTISNHEGEDSVHPDLRKVARISYSRITKTNKTATSAKVADVCIPSWGDHTRLKRALNTLFTCTCSKNAYKGVRRGTSLLQIIEDVEDVCIWCGSSRGKGEDTYCCKCTFRKLLPAGEKTSSILRVRPPPKMGCDGVALEVLLFIEAVRCDSNFCLTKLPRVNIHFIEMGSIKFVITCTSHPRTRVPKIPPYFFVYEPKARIRIFVTYPQFQEIPITPTGERTFVCADLNLPSDLDLKTKSPLGKGPESCSRLETLCMGYLCKLVTEYCGFDDERVQRLDHFESQVIQYLAVNFNTFGAPPVCLMDLFTCLKSNRLLSAYVGSLCGAKNCETDYCKKVLSFFSL
jgi:hypothetical protein